MLVKKGGRVCLEARAKAEPAEDVITRDYYTQLPHVRLTGPPETTVDVTLDDSDVAKLVECAIRHHAPNMRYAVLATVWNHPDSFREILRFGLNEPPGFDEVRKIVAEELDKSSATREPPAAGEGKPAVETLLPRMPSPAHLRNRGRTE